MTATLVHDPHPLFAHALTAALRREGLPWVLAVTSLQETVERIAQGQVQTLVLSLRQDAGPALTLLRGLRASETQVRVICLTRDECGAHQQSALEAGADHVLARTRPLNDVVATITGGPDSVRTAKRSALLNGRSAPGAQDARLRFLTARERETFSLLVAAGTTESIARQMHITPGTARAYVQAVLEKLGVHSRVEAIALAARHQHPFTSGTAAATTLSGTALAGFTSGDRLHGRPSSCREEWQCS